MYLVPSVSTDAWRTVPAMPIPAATRVPQFANCLVSSHRHLSWVGLEADLISYRCHGPFSQALQADTPRLFAVLESVGSAVKLGPRRDGMGTRTGNLSVVEGGEPVWAAADGLRYLRLLVVTFDEEALRERPVVASRLMFGDPIVSRLAQLLASVCEQDADGAMLYGDSLAVALTVALSRLDRVSLPARGGLAPKQLKRVLAHLSGNLDQELALTHLAGMVGLSVSHFSRAFKASTGISPRNWLIGARIDLARELLLEGRVPLAQMAVMLGFVDQAHLTRTFSRIVGVSPALWRHKHH